MKEPRSREVQWPGQRYLVSFLCNIRTGALRMRIPGFRLSSYTGLLCTHKQNFCNRQIPHFPCMKMEYREIFFRLDFKNMHWTSTNCTVFLVLNSLYKGKEMSFSFLGDLSWASLSGSDRVIELGRMCLFYRCDKCPGKISRCSTVT